VRQVQAERQHGEHPYARQRPPPERRARTQRAEQQAGTAEGHERKEKNGAAMAKWIDARGRNEQRQARAKQ